MEVTFYVSAAVALLSTLMVITRRNAVHALLYLIVSLLAVAMVFFVMGAAFVAALEVIIYAGAIMVLFVFAIMVLNLGPQSTQQERDWLRPRTWLLPGGLSLVLLVELLSVLSRSGMHTVGAEIGPSEVARSLFGPYVLGAELAALILLAGLVGAYHLARRSPRDGEEG